MSPVGFRRWLPTTTIAWLVVAPALLALAAAWLWRVDADSFRSTWEAVAAGAERIPARGALTVWNVARGTISPESALSLVVARVTGEGWARESYGALVVVLAFLWAAGARRISLDLEADEILSGSVGVVAGVLALHLAEGRIMLLAAAPALWLVSAHLRGAGVVPRVATLAALAALSRPGFLLAFPLDALATLWRAARDERRGATLWLPPLVSFVLFLLLPEPGWSTFFRIWAPHSVTGGVYDLPEPSLAWAMTHPFAARPVGIGVVVAMGLWLAAIRGSARARSRERALLTMALSFWLVSLGAHWLGLSERWGVSGPAAFLVLLVPSLKLHPFTDLAGMLAGSCLLALAARVSIRRSPGLVFLVLALVPLASSWESRSAAEAGEPALAARIGKLERKTLALPLSPANDQRWRRAFRAESRLLNGLQEILDRDAPLLARELSEADPETARAWLARLGVEQVIVTDDTAQALGQVLASADGESLVRLAPPGVEAVSLPCLPAETWRLRSSVGVPAVSVSERAVDGNLRTRWGTGAPQQPGQFFEIDLGGLHRLSRLELALGTFVTDYPRGFRVLASNDEKSWAVVAERKHYLGEVAWSEGFPHYDAGKSGIVRVPLRGVEARALRVELVRRARTYDWSIAEICLRGERIPDPETSR